MISLAKLKETDYTFDSNAIVFSNAQTILTNDPFENSIGNLMMNPAK